MTGATWRYAPQVRELISRFEDANQELNRYRNDESAASQMHRDLSAMSSQLTEALARAGILCDENTSLLEQVPHACHAPATRLPRACHAPATRLPPPPSLPPGLLLAQRAVGCGAVMQPRTNGAALMLTAALTRL